MSRKIRRGSRLERGFKALKETYGVDTMLSALTLEERLSGLSSEEILRQLSSEEVLHQLSSEEIVEALSADKKRLLKQLLEKENDGKT